MLCRHRWDGARPPQLVGHLTVPPNVTNGWWGTVDVTAAVAAVLADADCLRGRRGRRLSSARTDGGGVTAPRGSAGGGDLPRGGRWLERRPLADSAAAAQAAAGRRRLEVLAEDEEELLPAERGTLSGDERDGWDDGLQGSRTGAVAGNVTAGRGGGGSGAAGGKKPRYSSKGVGVDDDSKGDGARTSSDAVNKGGAGDGAADVNGSNSNGSGDFGSREASSGRNDGSSSDESDLDGSNRNESRTEGKSRSRDGGKIRDSGSENTAAGNGDDLRRHENSPACGHTGGQLTFMIARPFRKVYASLKPKCTVTAA